MDENKRLYALVDANNFYATCESIFDPRLQGKSLVVLSNNDGCIVARSAEAKANGIPMGAPLHEWRDFCDFTGTEIKSSNYALYGDMSRRMLSVLQDNCERVESYSIDESFLDLTGQSDPTQMGYFLRSEVRRRTKITCGVGIGPTKTLAKFANMIAKKQPWYGGVFNIADQPHDFITNLFEAYPVNEVWGVGNRLKKSLEAHGIKTVLDLAMADPKLIRTHFNVVLEKTVRELWGEPCLSLEEVAPDKQQIMASRSFGQTTTNPKDLAAAIANHVSRAAEKLRAQNSQCQYVYVMLRTNPFREKDPQYRRSTIVPLAVPSSDTRVLLKAAMVGLNEIFKSGYRYHKAGIMLSGISQVGVQQADLFTEIRDEKSDRLMSTIDQINQRFGRGTLHVASTDLTSQWKMRQDLRSPSYTTNWKELPVVIAN